MRGVLGDVLGLAWDVVLDAGDEGMRDGVVWVMTVMKT